MTVKFNVSGNERKELVKAVAEYTGQQPSYQGPPSFSYRVGNYTIGRTGELVKADGIAPEVLDYLAGRGFEAEPAEPVKLEISVPEKSANTFILQQIIGSKGTLIMHALGTDDVSIKIENGKITFPWFDCEQGSDEAQAYMLFVTALCRMSKSIKKVNTWDKEVPNEKYAFRCFLLRLGFIGDEYKAARKVLLKNLDGNTAFRSKEAE